MSPTKRSLLSALPFAILLALHAWYYLPFLSDDSLISLRYSQRLVEGNGLTWTAGTPVEGYSNLLWVLCLAIPHLVGVDLIVAARALGIIFALSVVLSLRPRSPQSGILPNVGSWASMAFVAFSAPMAIWAVGGLEQTLIAALLALSIGLLFQFWDEQPRGTSTLAWLSLVLGLICITRPDGPIFVVACLLPLMFAARGDGIRIALTNGAIIMAGPIVFYGGQLVFRLFYYGDYVPNTARVKIAPSSYHLGEGLKYVESGFRALGPLSLVGLALIVVMLWRRTYRPHAVYLGLALVLWNGYLAVIGGDIFPGHRHFVVNVVLLAFALKYGLQSLQLASRGPGIRRFAGALLIILFIPFGITQFRAESNLKAVAERWEWDGRKVGLWLNQAYEAEQPLVAVTAAGCIPYWSELPSLDMMGLNDHYLPRHPPEDFGNGFIGHELGGGQYVLDREPDIIVFHTGDGGPLYRVIKELKSSPRTLEMYAPVSIKLDPTGTETGRNALLFFHRFSAKVGMQIEGQHLTIPAHFFTEQRAAAYFNGEGRIEVALATEKPLVFNFRESQRRQWKALAVKGADAALVAVDVQLKGDMVWVQLSTESDDPVRFENVVLAQF